MHRAFWRGELCEIDWQRGGSSCLFLLSLVAASVDLQYNFNVTIPALLSQRRRLRRNQPKPALITGLGLSGFLSIAAVLLLIAAGGSYLWLVQDLPTLAEIPARIQNADGALQEPTKFYDRTGQTLLYTLQHPGAAGSQYLTADPGKVNSIPLPLVEATLAVIQPDFWTSPGYDLQINNSETEPTLAQSLVADLLLRKETPGVRRSLRERLLAGQLIRQYGHSVALEWFLNSRQFGPMVYGADAASRAYFGIPASGLSFAQAAWLTALAEMPGIDPYNPPARLNDRQREILGIMFDQERLTVTEINEALQEKITLQTPAGEPGIADELVTAATLQAEAALGNERVARGGLRIITTLEINLQAQATCTLATQIARLENRQDADTGACPAGRLLPSLAPDVPAGAGTLHGAIAILDAQTGQIRAMTGSSLALRQTGSLLTPFVYLTAFSRGYTPASLFWDIPPASQESEDSARDYLGSLRLRTALANNYSGPAEQILDQLGNESIYKISAEFGLTNQAVTFTANQEAGQSRPVLAGGESTLLDAAYAFNILANGGVATGQQLPGSIRYGGFNTDLEIGALHPTAIWKIYDDTGQLVLDWTLPTTQPVASSALAYLVNHILSDEAARWPSLGHPNPLEIGRPTAAQIGRTPANIIGWTVGYTPFLTNAVWLESTDGGQAQIDEAAAGVWHALMQYASQEFPPVSWGTPPGITSMNVCAASGLLPSSACPAVTTEIFLNGTEPIQVDNIFRSFPINRDNGLLATTFTPPELIEEHTFMVVPAEATTWARQNGLPLPPDTYDVIYNRPPNANAQINSPGIFDHVNGIVQIRGTAGGVDFKYYRLQIGQGLNPQAWIQLGTDVTTKVSGGVLAEWDTSQLSGLYAVQLLVVGANQKLETAVTQVTIDNEPPSVSLRIDHTSGQSTGVVLFAEASDNLVLERVVFYVDDAEIGSLTRPPFSIYWEGRSGTHQLRAKAYDLAGNTNEAVLPITIK